MMYENAPLDGEKVDCQTVPSQYTSLLKTDENDESYSKVEYGKGNEIVELASITFDESTTDGDNKSQPQNKIKSDAHASAKGATDDNDTHCSQRKTFSKSKTIIVLMIGIMVVIAGASSTITVVLLKQDFENQLSKILEDVQNGGWSSWTSWTTCLLGCNGGEQTRNRSCTNPSPSQFGHACSGTDWQTKLCTCNSGNSNLSIRLVNGTSEYNGRLEIFINSEWGTVCDDEFSNDTATVVCIELGHQSGNARAYGEAHFGRGTGSIWLDNVNCTGMETSLLDCKHQPFGEQNCNHGEDVGVSCA